MRSRNTANATSRPPSPQLALKNAVPPSLPRHQRGEISQAVGLLEFHGHVLVEAGVDMMSLAALYRL